MFNKILTLKHLFDRTFRKQKLKVLKCVMLASIKISKNLTKRSIGFAHVIKQHVQ